MFQTHDRREVSNSLRDAKEVAKKFWERTQPITKIEIKNPVFVEDLGDKVKIGLEVGEVVISKARAPREIERWLESTQCTCCGKREMELGKAGYGVEKMETRLFGEIWCHECREKIKHRPMPKKKPCKILKKHNANHKKWLKGESVYSIDVAIIN